MCIAAFFSSLNKNHNLFKTTFHFFWFLWYIATPKNRIVYAIIDIETTGGSPKSDKITEIAIYIYDGEKVSDEFITLLNPERDIPYHITVLTGITNEMVADAPKFYEVAKQIVEITDNRIFVAHNAGFDYNFIKSEFRQLGYHFTREQICTVKLSRKLIPGLRSYSLGNLCNELGIEINDRHRAAGDALATVQVLETLLSLNNFDQNLFQEVAGLTFKGLHPNLDIHKIRNLPEETGVYYLHDEAGEIIYIGKSKNIKSRVVTHLQNKSSRRSMEMKEKIADVSVELTGNELIALLLESEEIKNHQPYFNRAQKRKVDNYGIFSDVNKDGYLCLTVHAISKKAEMPVVGFQQKKVALMHLEQLVDKYNLCQKLCGLYDTKGACFHHQIGMCPGTCIGEEPPDNYNRRVEMALGQYETADENFLIIDKGRNLEEKSVIKIEHGKYMGFGFFDVSSMNGDPEALDDCIRQCGDNRDVTSIIKAYLSKKRVERVIEY